MQNSSNEVTDTAVIDRADLPRTFLGTAWPLVALGLVLLMLLRACVPAVAPSTVPASPKSADGSPNGAAAAAQRPEKPPAPR